jgi:hypothetical protein
LSLLLPKKEKWKRYKTAVLSLCESVRVPRCKLFSPLTDFDETWNENHTIAGYFSRVRFSFLQSATRRGGMRTAEAKETQTSVAEIMHSNRV